MASLGVASRLLTSPLVVDLLGESSYARPSFDTFEQSSAGIALARADRTFAVCDTVHLQIVRHADARMDER